MTHHFAMTSSLLIKILKIDKFGVFSSDIDFKTKMDIFRDDISLTINQCHLQATEGSVRQPRSASKRSACTVCFIIIYNYYTQCNLKTQVDMYSFKFYFGSMAP